MAALKATHTPPITTDEPGMNLDVLLHGAALYLTLHGWAQGDFFEPMFGEAFPPACSLGAINICAHGRPILCSDDTAEDPNTDAAIRATRVLAAYLCPEYTQTVDIFAYMASAIDIVSGWNDDNERTYAEVIETLTDAANDWQAAHPTGDAQ